MTHIEIWYRCPVCRGLFDNHREATICKNLHPIEEETWAVSDTGKAVRVMDGLHPDNSFGGIAWALREADLSDNVEERKIQLAEQEIKRC